MAHAVEIRADGGRRAGETQGGEDDADHASPLGEGRDAPVNPLGRLQHLAQLRVQFRVCGQDRDARLRIAVGLDRGDQAAGLGDE